MASKKTPSQKYTAKKKKTREMADKLFQILIVKMYPKCLCCGQKSTVAHHFIRKSKSNYLRYAVKNGIPLCQKCHYELHSWRDGELSGQIALIKGDDWYQEIVGDKNKLVSTNLAWYQSKIKILEII